MRTFLPGRVKRSTGFRRPTRTCKIMCLSRSTWMNGFLKALTVLFASCGLALAAQPTVQSIEADADVPLDTQPSSTFWRGAVPVYMDADAHGHAQPRYRTEVRTRWTKQNLYFLFVCPYQQLNLKPNPKTNTETYELWKWDVAEVFIGADFTNIKRYKEFEISPQGEWVDLDIDLSKPHHEDGWVWNSDFEVMARIDESQRTWYGAMRIPWAAIDARPPTAGNTLRINLFRSQGPPPHPQAITWQPPMKESFHVPECFGLIRLVEKE